MSMPVTATSAPVSLLMNQTATFLDKCKSTHEIRQIHAHMIKTNLVTHNLTMHKFITVCSISGNTGLKYALSVFHQLQNPNRSMFHTLVKELWDSLYPFEAVILYAYMLSCLQEELQGVEFSLPFVLKACAKSGAVNEGMQILGHVMKTHMWIDPFVTNGLLRMFMELGEREVARRVFDKMPKRDLISCNSILTGYLRAGEIELATEIFEEMPERDLISCNTMIDGYGKHGLYEFAEGIFRMMSVRDVVSWTSMISAYALNQRPREALDLFREMLHSGIQPDGPAVVSVLSAIAELGFIEEGKWIHSYINTHRLHSCSAFIASALINMYAKCGQVNDAYVVFRSVSRWRNIGDWNAMISGFAMHGFGHAAIKVFLNMERVELKPDDITFIGLLSACNHGGLVYEGQHYFHTMRVKYNVVPKIQHYGCVIDLLGRAGYVEKALKLMLDMPVDPDVLIWKAILSACTKHANVAIGELAAMHAIELAPEDSSCYVNLSNIYAKAGRWGDVANVRELMKQRGVRKIPGCSSMLVDGKVYEFLSGKKMDGGHDHQIYCKIEEMISKLRLEGYEPDLSQVLLDVEDDRKESLLNFHSEKMAVAFALLRLPLGIPIHIVKNLRICCDCHSFMMLVSRIYNCKIIIRDQNRFHHFENGSCSCRGSW